MAVKPMVVQSDYWTGGGEGEPGSELVRRGTVVDIDTSNSELVEFYGGLGNLAPLPGNQSGDDADHSALGN
jgi:hypothetical protein